MMSVGLARMWNELPGARPSTSACWPWHWIQHLRARQVGHFIQLSRRPSFANFIDDRTRRASVQLSLAAGCIVFKLFYTDESSSVLQFFYWSLSFCLRSLIQTDTAAFPRRGSEWDFRSAAVTYKWHKNILWKTIITPCCLSLFILPIHSWLRSRLSRFIWCLIELIY